MTSTVAPVQAVHDAPHVLKQNSVDKAPRKVTLPSILKSTVNRDSTDNHENNDTSPTKNLIHYDRIKSLLSSRHSLKMYDRHLVVLDKMVRVFQRDGLPINDIHEIIEVLSLARDRLHEGGNELAEPLIILAKMASKPFIHEERTQETEPRIIRALFQFLSGAITSNNEQFGAVANEILHDLVVQPDIVRQNAREPHLPHTFSLSTCTPLIIRVRNDLDEGIDSPRTVVPALIEALLKTPCETQQATVLRTLNELSHLPKSCEIMAGSGLAPYLTTLLNVSTSDAVFSRSTSLLWTLLENDQSSESVSEDLIRPETFQNLRNAFVSLLEEGRRQWDKQLRNDILVIWTLMVRKNWDALSLFNMSGVLNVCLSALISAEFGASQSENYSLTFGEDDFEFKKLLTNLLAILSNDDYNLETMIKAGYMRYLFQYLTFTSTNPAISQWSKRQLKSIQLQALSSLYQLIPAAPQEYYSLRGHETLLKFLDSAMTHDVGILMEGANVDSEVAGLIPATIRNILQIAELNFEHRLDIVDEGVFPIMLRLLKNNSFKTDIHRDALLVCATVCQGVKRNKQLFGEQGGVSVILPFIKFQSPEPAEKQSMVIATIECIWETIVGCRDNEEEFFHRNGVYFLLDLLESLNSPQMRRHTLGCILDLMENPKARAHVLEWRSETESSLCISSLLIRLWNEEEANLGGKLASSIVQIRDVVKNYSTHGVLDNIKSPLQSHADVDPRQTAENSVAINEMNDNLRAKIYSMFCKIGFDTFVNLLSTEERMKLLLIQKYLDFKIGEIWDEISSELDYECIRPVSPDADCISVAKTMTMKKAEAIQYRQRDLARKKSEREAEDESTFYSQLVDGLKHRHDHEQKRLYRKVARAPTTQMNTKTRALESAESTIFN